MKRPELIIFEGPDGSGKTTLVEKIGTALQARGLHHHGPYLQDSPARLFNRYSKPLREHTNGAVIYDRSWLSEPIYGLIKRGKDRLGVPGRRYLDRLALSRRGIVVVPDTPFVMCEESYRKRKGLEYLDNIDQLRLVWQEYERLHEWTHLPVLRVSRRESVKNLLEIIEEHRPKLNQGPGVGNWDPDQVTLLVGEATSDAHNADLPFIAPSLKQDNCSAWLVTELEKHNIKESELYWINAKNRDGGSTSPDFLEKLRPARVIALGSVAAAWCHKIARVGGAEVALFELPHPQHWKRFHHHEPYALFDILGVPHV